MSLRIKVFVTGALALVLLMLVLHYFILFVFYFSFLSPFFWFFGFSQNEKILVMLQCEEFEG